MTYDGVNVNDKFGLYIKKKSEDYMPRTRPFILTQWLQVIYIYLHNGVQHVKPVHIYKTINMVWSIRVSPGLTLGLYQID